MVMHRQVEKRSFLIQQALHGLPTFGWLQPAPKGAAAVDSLTIGILVMYAHQVQCHKMLRTPLKCVPALADIM